MEVQMMGTERWDAEVRDKEMGVSEVGGFRKRRSHIWSQKVGVQRNEHLDMGVQRDEDPEMRDERDGG